MLLRWVIALFVLGAAFSAGAAEPEVESSQLPRIPPTPPEQALATFKVKPGFRIELVAAEPLVVSPVAMSFDEDGRLYVIEMRDYSERRPERLGRVRLLEDTDGDGRFDKSTVFADGLPWPTAVTCWAGGVFVGATPDILWMKDTSGDGVADEREVIFTGFASDYAPFATNKLNVQALMNSFQWTLENRIHGATSFSGGKVKLVDSPFVRDWLKRAGVPPSPPPKEERAGERRGDERETKPLSPALSPLRRGEGERPDAPDPRPQTPDPIIDLRGRDFSFDPRTLSMRPESGGGQHGMSFDNRGRKFVCSNSDHIQQIVYEDRYAARNPYYTMPNPRVSIAADGPAAEVFRISPDEPWRVLRTQWRVAGLAPGPVEGGGRASGYFTGATGVTIYRGDAYGEEFVGDAFIGDAGGNLVHRKKLRPDGILLRAERPADEQKVEFLASTDNWFRPVQFANAPDGCLYIADMYREVIEHPWSLPPNLKKHLDLNSGNDRGRLYRIVPENFKQRPPPRLSKVGTAELVKLLEHPNGWHRDTAARLLYARRDRIAVAALEKSLVGSKSSLARLHSLCTLHGLGVLAPESLGERALADKDPTVRLQSLRFIAAAFAAPSSSNVLLYTAAPLATNVDASVLFELALMLDVLPKKEHADGAESILRNGAADTWVRHAVLNSIGDAAHHLLTRLMNRDYQIPAKWEVVPELARQLGVRTNLDSVYAALNVLPVPGDEGMGLAVLAGFADGLRQAGVSLESLVPDFMPGKQLNGYFAAASEWTTNSLHHEGQAAAFRLLACFPYSYARFALLPLLDASQPPAVQSAALAGLGRFTTNQVAPEILNRWPKLGASLRGEALALLLKRPERIRALLAAIEKGSVPAAELSVAQQAQLRAHRDPAIREQAAKVFGRAATATRQSVVESFQPALTLKGDAANGRKIFQARCASCHKLGSEGHTLGPDLVTVKSGGKEKLLIAILDPNREVAPNFASYSVETKDGESLTGILASESAGSVTLRMAGGAESVIARANIASMQSQGRSLMPDGLEEGLKPQDMADLLEFILSDPR